MGTRHHPVGIMAGPLRPARMLFAGLLAGLVALAGAPATAQATSPTETGATETGATEAGTPEKTTATASPAGAGAVTLELNRLEQVDGACRAYLVIENGTGIGFESLGVDLVMFDAEGVVARRLAVELAPLSPGKTSVRVFSLDGAACDAVGRVLLNSVVSCADATGARPDCLGLIETSSRTAAPFIE